MKKILSLISLIVLAITLWLYNANWMVEKNTLNYAPNRGYPLFYALTQIEKDFSIRIMLPLKKNKIQNDLRAYYENRMPKELKKARDIFPTALRSTSLYKSLEKNLNNKGYWIDKQINFEKFGIYKEDYLFHADIYLEVFAFRELLKSVETTFPTHSKVALKTMLQNGLWNYEKSAIAVYPSDENQTSIYLFIKDSSDKFIAVDISLVEKVNLGAIGSNRHFDKVESKALQWLEHEKYYQIRVETKAWVKGKRYRHSEKLLIKKSGKVLWR